MTHIELHTDSMILREVDVKSEAFRKLKTKYSLWSQTRYGGNYISYSAITVIGNDAYMPRFIKPESIQMFYPNIQSSQNYLSTAPAGDIRMKMIHAPRDDTQKSAIAFLTEMAKSDNECAARFLSLPTGGGKTFVTISALAELGKRAMIFVDTLDLANQWVKEINTHSSLRAGETMILSGQDSITRALKNDKVKIFICMHQTAHAYMETAPGAFASLMNSLRIGVRVFDEAHVDFGNIIKINSVSDVMYSIFLTATPGRSGYENDRLYHDIFDSVPLFSGTAVNRYHTVVVCRFDSKPTDKMLMSSTIQHGASDWFSGVKWADFIVTPECYPNYEKALFSLIDQFGLIVRGKKFFIMCPTIELIKKTQESINKHYHIEPSLFIGEADTEEREKALKSRIVITNEKMLGKGLNVLDLDALINFVQYGSPIMAKQIMGRLRNIPGHNHLMFDITDAGYPDCERLQKARLKFYRFNAKEVIYLDKVLGEPVV